MLHTETAMRRFRAAADNVWMQRLSRGVLCLAVFWMSAAATHAGFFAKWGLRDVDPSGRFAIGTMLDGTAARPFVYRQLVPWLAAQTERLAPEPVLRALRDEVRPSASFSRAVGDADPATGLRYRIVYVIVFLSFLGTLFAQRALLRALGCEPLLAVLVPALCLLTFPYIQTIGGYFYDASELLCLSLTLWAAVARHHALLLGLTALATLNKETFFFFLPGLHPLLTTTFTPRARLGFVALLVGISGAINVALKVAYAGNPGAPAEFHALENATLYTRTWFYHLFEDTYGVVGPQGFSILSLAVVGAVYLRYWRGSDPRLQGHLRILMAINLPLFFLLCAAGELRNLSLLYPGTVALAALGLDRALRARLAAAPA